MSSTVNGVPLSRWLASTPAINGHACARCGAPLRSDGSACTGAARHPRRIGRLTYYATLSTTHENTRAMNMAGMRVLMGPDQLDRWRGVPPLSWACDNGAWGAHTNGRPWDAAAFRDVLVRWGDGADWIVLPDIVAGGAESLSLSLSWLAEVRRYARPLLAVQDGMGVENIAPLVGPSCGLFIGGSTEWKWRTVAAWGELAARTGAYLHVGRVNSAEAIAVAVGAGASSVDGTGPSRFSVNAPRLGAATADAGQSALPLFGAP